MSDWIKLILLNLYFPWFSPFYIELIFRIKDNYNHHAIASGTRRQNKQQNKQNSQEKLSANLPLAQYSLPGIHALAYKLSTIHSYALSRVDSPQMARVLSCTNWFKKSAFVIWHRLAKEVEGFFWLVNKVTLRCFALLLSLFGCIWMVERLIGTHTAWWLLMNLSLLFLGATKMARQELRKFCGFYEEYPTYVITIK